MIFLDLEALMVPVAHIEKHSIRVVMLGVEYVIPDTMRHLY